jgi:integrase
MSRRGLPTGVQRKHSRACPAWTDKTARCRGRGCSYQVQAGPRGARQTKTFPTVDAAVAWKRDVDMAKAQGRLTVGRAPTLREAAEQWHVDALAGVALARGRKPFKPGTLKDYRRNLDVDLVPEYGATRLDELGEMLDGLVADLQRSGKKASTVRNVLMPLRAIYRHGIRMNWVTLNPTLGLEVPTGSGRRMRIVEPRMIALYLAALDELDRPLWATAFYTGWRRGELQAVRWSEVDLATGVISVDADQGAYDQRTGTTQGPKSGAGARSGRIAAVLREILIGHRSRAGARPSGLVFARGMLAGTVRGDPGAPFNDSSTGARARQAWIDAGLPPISLHDCRHTFASMLIAAQAQAGVFDPKVVQEVMGHSSIQVTYDRYGHLFPGAQDRMGVMLDDFLSGIEDGSSELLPPVAQAWSRAREEIENTEPQQALPTVTEALCWLRTWQDTHDPDGLVASPSPTVAADAQRAVRVQRSQHDRDPR